MGLTAAQRDAVRHLGPYADAYDLPLALHQMEGLAVGTWSFARDGGATGDYNLKNIDGTNLVLPSGTLITNVVVVATTAVTSGGSMTVDVNANAANDCLAAEAVAGLTANARIQGIPDLATVADWVRLTADRTMSISLNTAAATAGVISVLFWFVNP